jgi:hypothetical protein
VYVGGSGVCTTACECVRGGQVCACVECEHQCVCVQVQSGVHDLAPHTCEDSEAVTLDVDEDEACDEAEVKGKESDSTSKSFTAAIAAMMLAWAVSRGLGVIFWTGFEGSGHSACQRVCKV